MKLKLFLSAALVAGVISASAAASGAAAPVLATPAKTDTITALFGDPVIAKGRGFEIKRSELDEIVSGAKAQAAAGGQTLPPNFEGYMLNQLITMQLLVQKATPADRATGQAESDTQFTNILTRYDSPEAFARQLKIIGMTEADLRKKATMEATAKAALKRELNLTISDAQIKEAYSNHAASFEEPEKAHARHILLLTIDPSTRPPTPLATNTVAAKRKTADEVLKRVKAGEDFAKLAKEFSEDPTTKETGGELQKFGRGDMLPEFEAAAFALGAGQVSDVVQTMYGFHIIKLIEKLPAKKYGLMDNIPQIEKTPAAVCKSELEGEQIRDRAPALVQKLRAAANVEIIDPALKTMDQAMQEAASSSAPTPPPATKP